MNNKLYIYIFLKCCLVEVLFIVDFIFFKFLCIFLPVLLVVAFFTLLERKVLASFQRRRGPNVIGLFGFFQAFADAFKMLGKETIIPDLSSIGIFLSAPIITFFVSFIS